MPTVHLSVLDSIAVASPCHEAWESMTGDERTRRCAACKLNVHNIAGMTRSEAEAFLEDVIERKKTDPDVRVCVRFFRRQDGTILTRDCPVGLAAVKRRARLALARTAAGIGAALTTVWASAGLNGRASQSPRVRAMEPFHTLSEWLAPTAAPAPPIMGRMMMGDYCPMPAPTSAPAPAQPSDLTKKE